MESIVKFLLEEQGFCYRTLSEESRIKSYKLYNLLNYNKNYLSINESKRLNEISMKGSFKFKKKSLKILDKDNKKYLDVLSILPEKSRYGLPFFEKSMSKNYVKVWYQPKTRGKTEYVFPKEIELNEFFFTGLGLSVGDGLNNPSIRNTHYNFANINFELVYLIIDWLRSYFNISLDTIQLFLVIPKRNTSLKESCLKDISKIFPEKEVKVYVQDRNKNPSLSMQLGNSVFQSFYLNLFKSIRKIIIENEKYRRTFLKGLFAAEGHIKHSVYDTIEGIGFSFNPKEEIEIANFVKRSLIKEGIKSKINKNGYIYFCGYEGMLKFFLLGIMDLHKEKRNKFIKLINNIKKYKVSIYLKREIMKKISKFSQQELAQSIGLSQSSVSDWIKDGRVEINVFEKAFPILDANLEELIKNIRYIGVSNTKIKNRQSIRYLLSLYNLNDNEYKIKLKGKRCNLSIQSRQYLILKSVVDANKSGEISTRRLKVYNGYSHIGAQQWLQRLRGRGLIEVIGKTYNNMRKVYRLTDKGRELYNKLDKMYEIIGEVS